LRVPSGGGKERCKKKGKNKKRTLVLGDKKGKKGGVAPLQSTRRGESQHIFLTLIKKKRWEEDNWAGKGKQDLSTEIAKKKWGEKGGPLLLATQ